MLKLTPVHLRRVVGCPVPPRNRQRICSLRHSLWCGTNLLDNWQLASVSQSEYFESNPQTANDNLSVPLRANCCYIRVIKATNGLLAIRFQRSCVRSQHSAEEDNWFPFDSISLPCYQCIKINTNKHAYRQSQG